MCKRPPCDAGRVYSGSQHFSGSLEYGFSLVAFWQQKAKYCDERKLLASTCLYPLYAWFVYRFVSLDIRNFYRATHLHLASAARPLLAVYTEAVVVAGLLQPGF